MAPNKKNSKPFKKQQPKVLYFDAALPVTLLYAKERPQYALAAALHPGVPPSKLYGCEHLLRLFTKLPSVLACAGTLATVEASQLQAHLQEFLKHVQKNSASLLAKSYVLLEGSVQPAAGSSQAVGSGGSAAVGEPEAGS